jgi:hypothetical protein
MMERCLRDGTRHHLIKVVRGPADITRQLIQLGWQPTITPTGDWLVGQARPTPMPQPERWPHGPMPSSTRTALMTKLQQPRRLSRSACRAGPTVTLWSPDRSAGTGAQSVAGLMAECDTGVGSVGCPSLVEHCHPPDDYLCCDLRCGCGE